MTGTRKLKSKDRPSRLERAARAIVRVGDGRGFVVGADHHRYVITAAHCLPHFPPALSFSSSRECTYQALLGPLGQELTASAECVFTDPIGDIAVLGCPDPEAFGTEADAHFIDREALRIGDIALTLDPGDPVRTDLWLLGLDGGWIQCAGMTLGKGIWTTAPSKGPYGGLSGSPLLTRDGRAVGIFVAGRDDDLRSWPRPPVDNLVCNT